MTTTEQSSRSGLRTLAWAGLALWAILAVVFAFTDEAIVRPEVRMGRLPGTVRSGARRNRWTHGRKRAHTPRNTEQGNQEHPCGHRSRRPGLLHGAVAHGRRHGSPHAQGSQPRPHPGRHRSSSSSSANSHFGCCRENGLKASSQQRRSLSRFRSSLRLSPYGGSRSRGDAGRTATSPKQAIHRCSPRGSSPRQATGITLSSPATRHSAFPSYPRHCSSSRDRRPRSRRHSQWL